MTKRELELTEQVAALETRERLSNEEYGRFYAALDGLMRAVLLEVAVDYNHPTSIACGRLIAAVATASRVVLERPR